MRHWVEHEGAWLPSVGIDAMPPSPRDGFAYLATPYTHYTGGMDAAAKAACVIAGALIRRDIAVFCPIAESHAIAVAAGLDQCDFSLWMRQDRPKLRAASALIVADLDGWRDSRGVREEIRLFAPLGRPMMLLSTEGLL